VGQECELLKVTVSRKEPGSSVSLVSDYGLDYRATEVWSPAEDFSSNLCSATGSVVHPASCPMGTGDPFPAVKLDRGLTLTTHPHLVPRSWMSRSYTFSPPAPPSVNCGLLYLYSFRSKTLVHRQWKSEQSYKCMCIRSCFISTSRAKKGRRNRFSVMYTAQGCLSDMLQCAMDITLCSTNLLTSVSHYRAVFSFSYLNNFK
jgi:hypothetical protein